MEKKYYIPNLPFIKKYLKGKSKNVIVKGESNLVEFKTKEDMNLFLDSIRTSEFINDSELLSNIKKYLPGVEKYFHKKPVSHQEIIDTLMFIFNDYPPDLLDDDNSLTGLRKFFNHIIRKNETTFIIENIKNGTLSYDKEWNHRKFQDFYFEMKKMVYNLDTYYFMFYNIQYLLRDISLREIVFSDEYIDDKKEEVLNRIFNIYGNNFLDLKQRLVHWKNQIQNNHITLKRTKIMRKLPHKYKEMEESALNKIENTIKDIDKNINGCEEMKLRLREEMKRRHRFLSKHTLKKILNEFRWFRPFTKK